MPEIVKKCCSRVQQRYIMYFLTFGALAVCYLDRQTYFKFLDDIVIQDPRKKTDSVSKCPIMISGSKPNLNYQAQFYWSTPQVTIITHCFYIGYLVVLIPSGVIADIYGAKGVMGLGVSISSITSLVSPSLAEAFGRGPINFKLTHFFQGVAQGLVIPATAVVIANWAPVTIRATACGIISSGMLFGWGYGYIQHDLILSYLAEDPHIWKVTFYVSGSIGLVWVVLWFCLTGSCPVCSAHPTNNCYISQAEIDLLKKGLEGVYHDRTTIFNTHVPWRSIVTSLPLLSLIAIHWASSWMHFLALAHFEQYLRHVINITEKLSYNITAFAEFTMVPSAIFWGFVSDWLINKNYISRTANRKYFGFFSNILMIPCMIGMLSVSCNGLAAVSLYVTFCFVRSPYYSALRANAIDLSPQHAGLLHGILSCTSAVSALFITEFYNSTAGSKPNDINTWWTMFGVSSIILLLLSLPFLCFASADLQPWNYYQPRPRGARTQTSTTQTNDT